MRIFSGIQPTGRKHLGNYIGAIVKWVEDQDRGDPAIYCVVDLHAITVSYDPAELRERSLDTAATLIAAGLDPARCVLFRQGDVAEHTELSWLLSSVTELGRLQRMHQFRDKSVAQRELVSAGLLMYPVLMAADVLAYRAHEVPVGEDQREHLELMRDVAERFNARFGDTLVVPEPHILKESARIMDLQEPTAKMSKSSSTDKGLISLLDDPKRIAKKIRSAVTDTEGEVRYDVESKPGVSNLLSIHSALSGTAVADLESSFAGRGYGDLKQEVADVVVAAVEPYQRRMDELMADPGELDRILAKGAARASEVAAATRDRVYDRVGLLAARG